jgi:GNAT superfamily N-acetyltransferase
MPLKPQFIHVFRAKNGLEIRVRAMLPSDAPYLVDIFEHMSAESRYLRFNLPMQDPDPDWVRMQAERLAYLPPYEGRAWLAFADLPDAPETAVGGIRYMALTPDSAEVALVVRDDLQALGIGSSLIEFAAKKAYSEGYRKLVGIIQSANLPLWRSLKGLAIPMTTSRDGAATVIEVDLQEAVLLRWRAADKSETAAEPDDKQK